MPNKIKPKRSYTANSVPLTSDLDTHELAINWVDGKAFTKDASGNIVSVTLGGSGGGSDARWDLFLPPAPTSVTATAGNAQAVVAWTAPTGVIAQAPVTSYVLQYKAASASTWVTWPGAPASGGTLVDDLTNGTAYTFRVAAVNSVGTGAYSTASSSVTPSVGVSVSYLVVAGGGGGGFYGGGGGGAGGYLSGTQTLSAGTYAIAIGSGGPAGNDYVRGGSGLSGSNSSLGTIAVAIGGGGGGGMATNPASGGSGGGGGSDGDAGSYNTGAAGTAGQGNAGGNGRGPGLESGGGGGGAGAAGGAGTSSSAGAGGNGLQWVDSNYYAGGGGGYADNGLNNGAGAGAGGLGGGGRGSQFYNSDNALAGTQNRGGGGGGGYTGSNSPGSYGPAAGGSGVVILRTLATAASTTGSPTVTQDGSYNVYTFTGSGSITF
jgi:hypothetical protein